MIPPSSLRIPFHCALLIIALATTCASAQAQSPRTTKDIGFDQKLDSQLPLDAQFTDETGAAVRLGDYFQSKPVLLTPVYYRCPMLCGLELKGLLRCLRAMSLKPGVDFEIVTYSIDHREGPELAREKRGGYLKALGQPDAAKGWHFLTGGEESIRRLNEAIGFRTEYDAATGQYAHAAGIVACTPKGRSSRYFYGVEFSPRDVTLGLVEASKNTIGSLTDHVLLYCYLYDPTNGKYGLAILNIIRAAGILTVLVLAGSIGWMIRRDRIRQSNLGIETDGMLSQT